MNRLKVDVENSALQGAILGNIAWADPIPVDAVEVFFKVCLQEDASLPQFVDALMELKDLGLVRFVGPDCAVWRLRLTDNGRQHVSVLITDALRALGFSPKVADA